MPSASWSEPSRPGANRAHTWNNGEASENRLDLGLVFSQVGFPKPQESPHTLRTAASLSTRSSIHVDGQRTAALYSDKYDKCEPEGRDSKHSVRPRVQRRESDRKRHRPHDECRAAPPIDT